LVSLIVGVLFSSTKNGVPRMTTNTKGKGKEKKDTESGDGLASTSSVLNV